MKNEMPTGIRVGAVNCYDEHSIELFGYGTYQGRTPITETVTFEDFLKEYSKHQPPGLKLSEDENRKMAENVFYTPTILLDNGTMIYGYECWWGLEDEVRTLTEKRTVLNADIVTIRKSYEE